MATLGERICLVRDEAQLNQTEFGKLIGLKQGTISQIEKDAKGTSDRTLTAICREFHVNFDWLRYGKGPMRQFTQPTDMEKLEAIMSGKSEVKKSFILALADMPEALLDEMLPYLRKAVAELDRR